MQKALLACFFLLFSIITKSQDYFTDLTSGTTPVLFNGTQKALFSATVNAGDNSVKANFFRQYFMNARLYDPLALPRKQDFIGWGINAKTKTEDGLGPLFGSGEFNPGFTGGVYLSYSRMSWKKKDSSEVFGQYAFILSGTLTTSQFQLYNETNSFATQLSDTIFKGRTLSLSFVKGFFGGKDNVLLGVSVTASRMNNYNKLDKVDIENDSIFTNGAGRTRTVQLVNDNGNIFGTGEYKQFNNFNIRANLSYIPSALNYFIAFIGYPSIDYSKAFQPKYNIGISFAHLKQGNPAASDAALFFELNDITNVADKNSSFLKRSFKFGISTTLNIFTSSK